jgi:hypothetical protein
MVQEKNNSFREIWRGFHDLNIVIVIVIVLVYRAQEI